MNTMSARNCEIGVGRPTHLIKLFFSNLKRYHQNIRTRYHLSQLPEHLYQDIGVPKEQIKKELNKPFWK
ncbi:DUF1127 domain-containing protein [Vibrio sp. T187]|uniref:DUF1127 domain-containing protein n=1 Tax=Vibrio TaxID=662 RepID=UPI0010C97F18|nr:MULTISPECIES: DUF1127 domain-containing protein [Vibrio]MBW3694235.1 DUF1127 domain-containing protein [Vibrio sp. T187]